MTDKIKIPNGWAQVELGFFMKTGTGSVDPSKYKDEVFELYSIPFYDSGKPEIVKGEKIGSSKKVLSEKDVLLSRIVPHIQRSWIVGPYQGYRQIGSGEWIIFDGTSINPKYLRYFLLSYNFHMKFMTTISGVGGSLTRANPNLTAKFSILIPPLNEQNRIVEKLDELLSELEKGKEQLQASLEQLKVYRQSILKHAFEGKLFNPDFNKDELPNGWKKESFIDVSTKIGDIDHKMPKKVEDGIYPYLSTGDISDENELDFIKAKKITREDYVSLSRKIKPEKDDIIFPRYGTIGRNVLVKTDKEFLVSYSCAIIKPNKEKILPKYLYYYSLSPQIKKEIEKYIVQTTQANVGISSIKSFEVKYPISLDAQEKIVIEIEQLLSNTNKTEVELINNLTNADVLMQSLLQKAFEGKLIEQDPSDEPASVLLERIKKKREEYLMKEKEKKKIQKKPMKKKNDTKVFEFPLLDTIKHKFGKNSFTFDQLKSEVDIKYDDLREELFSLLDNEKALTMEFDQGKEAMNFKYVGQ